MFPATIVAIYYMKYGLTMRDLFLIQSISSVMIAIFEVPTGYFSDRFGRKNSLMSGLTISLVGFTIIGTSFEFTGFLIGEMFLGLGVTFISGTDSAILYETFKNMNRIVEYPKAEAKFQSFHHLGEFSGVVLGGFIAAYSLRATYAFRSLFILIAIIVAYKLIEPSSSHVPQRKPKIWFSVYRHTKRLWYVFAVSSLIFAFMIIGFWFVQPLLKESDAPIVLFGVIFAVLKLVSFISARYSASINNKIKISGSIALMIILISLGYSGIYFFEGYIRLLFIIPFYLTAGLYTPIINSAINDRIESKSRATVLSINNLFGRLFFSALAPFIGFFSDLNGMGTTFIFISLIIISVGSILWSVFLIKKRKINERSQRNI